MCTFTLNNLSTHVQLLYLQHSLKFNVNDVIKCYIHRIIRDFFCTWQFWKYIYNYSKKQRSKFRPQCKQLKVIFNFDKLGLRADMIDQTITTDTIWTKYLESWMAFQIFFPSNWRDCFSFFTVSSIILLCLTILFRPTYVTGGNDSNCSLEDRPATPRVTTATACISFSSFLTANSFKHFFIFYSFVCQCKSAEQLDQFCTLYECYKRCVL